jgi:hypothetical protein
MARLPLKLLILLAALAAAAMPGGGAARAQEWWSTSWEKRRARALRDRTRLVVGGVADAATEAGGVIRNSRLSALKLI